MSLKHAVPFVLGTALCLGMAGLASPQAEKTSQPDKMIKPEKMKSDHMDKSGSGASAADTKFAHNAAIGGLMEVELGKVATQKASNEKVKQFGQRMVDDHGKANDELKSVAAKKNITLPTEIDAPHKNMVDRLSKLSGASFDKAYMRDMVRDHQKDIAEFQKESTSGSDSDLKSFASSTLPTLQEHLKMAQEASAEVNAKPAAK